MRKINYLIFILLSVFVMSSCSTKIDSKLPVIVVSIPPQQYFADKLVGDKMDVRCLLEKGGNPEIYEPTPSDIISIEQSDLYMMMGYLPFETNLVSKIMSNKPDLNVVDTSKGVDVLLGTHGDCPHHHEHVHSHNHDADPHTWSSVKNAKIIVKNMYDAIIDIDVANKDYYAENYRMIKAHLDSIDGAIAEKLEVKKGKSFLVWHPSLSYFARDYGLNQISVWQNGKETTVQSMQTKINEAEKSNATVFFLQKDYDARQTEVISQQIETNLVYINPLNYNWEEEINNIVNAIVGE